MSKTLLCLGGNVEALPIIQRVAELGFRPIVVDWNAVCAAARAGFELVQASCYEGEKVIRELEIGDWKPDGVMCCAVDAPGAAAMIAEKFGLPGLSQLEAGYSVDKVAQMARLYGVTRIPIFEECASAEQLMSFRPRDKDAVVKPRDSRGGRGVMRMMVGQQGGHVDPVLAFENAKAHSPTGGVIVEEWLDGPQLSTESIVQDGQVLFTAIALRNYARLEEFAPFVIEDGSDTPASMGREGATEIDHVINAACRALGWYQQGGGTVKGDLVIQQGRVHVIELAARLSGGFFASHITPLAYGVDFVGLAAEMALGYTIEAPKAYDRGYVCQRYVFPEKSDIGKSVEAIDYTPPGGTWNLRVGQVIEPVTSHPQRWGQCITMGTNDNEARKWAEAGVEGMKAGVILSTHPHPSPLPAASRPAATRTREGEGE